MDISLSRAFTVSRLGEAGRLIVRADAFNVLNHANLNNPAEVVYGAPGFGVALYGGPREISGFPAVTPFNETARNVQLELRVDF